MCLEYQTFRNLRRGFQKETLHSTYLKGPTAYCKSKNKHTQWDKTKLNVCPIHFKLSL